MWSEKFRATFVIILYYILVLLLFPIFLILFIPIVIIRRTVSLLSQFVGPASLGKILTASASSHASTEGRGTCILPFTVKGTPDLELIRNQFIKSILNAKDTTGKLLYPELRQTVVSWGGYLFWKDVPNFQLPIRLAELSELVDLSSPSGLELLRSLYNEEWNFGEGLLWELLIVPGTDGNFGLVFRFHHALCDVLALQKMIDKLCIPSIVATGNGKNGMDKTSHSPFRLIRTLLRMPYDATIYLESVLRTTPLPTTETSQRSNDLNCEINNDTKPDLTLASEAFHLPDLKRIAVSHGVSVNAVLISSIQGSLKKIWNEEKNSILFFPTPDPRHPEKLRNVGGMGYVELLQGLPREQRLREIHSQLQNQKSSSFPQLVNMAGTFSGFMPAFLIRRTINGASGNFRTILLSTFVASRHEFSLFGYPVIRIESFGSDHSGTRVVAFFAFSSVDGMRFTVMGDERVLSKAEGKGLIHGVAEEFQSLKEALDKKSTDHSNVSICI